MQVSTKHRKTNQFSRKEVGFSRKHFSSKQMEHWFLVTYYVSLVVKFEYSELSENNEEEKRRETKRKDRKG